MIKIFFIKKTINQFCFSSEILCAHLELKETILITLFLLSKAHPVSVNSVAFHFEQFCRAQISDIDVIISTFPYR